MSELRIRSSRGEYDVLIGVDFLRSAIPAHAFALVDSAVAGSMEIPPAQSLVFESNEANKSLTGCETVLKAMQAAGCVRESVLLAIGGGVVQDVGTLAASLYMRGLPWIYAPTTFMAMADSCIGGKSSINVAGIKNLVGNIYPPRRVIVDLGFTRSLSPSAIASGLAEAVKINYARGADAFHHFARLRAAATTLDSTAGVQLVEHTLRSKQWFIEVDEFDRAERRLLNFGHTFAHAIESGVHYAIPHGIAVALGMMAALRHPLAECGPRESELLDECRAILAPALDDIRAPLDGLDAEVFRRAFQRDKKHTSEHFHLILPRSGQLAELTAPKSTAAVDAVLEATLTVRSELAA